MRKIVNYLGSLLIFIRYRNKKDPFLLFSKIMKNVTLPEENNNKVILIAPLRVAPISNLFEGLMAYFYRMKGYTVGAIMCDQAVTFCENISKDDKHKDLICALCKKEQDRFCKIFKVENISVRKELSLKKEEEVDEIIMSRDFKKDEDFVFDGVDLKEDIIAGTMRYTLRSSVENDLDIVKQFAKTAFVFSTTLKTIQKRKKAELLFLSHGIYSSWGSLTTTSKQIGLNSIVWGRGYVGQGNLLFGHNKNYHEDFIYENNTAWENQKLTEKQKEETYLYFSQKTNKSSKTDYVNYYKDLKLDSFDVKEFWSSLEKYEKKYAMYSNIPWDGQVFNKTESFPTTEVFTRSTIEWFKVNSDCCLIIRAHPAELTGSGSEYTETFEQLLSKTYPVLPKNIYFLPPDNPISSYDLVKQVDASILYGSTLSLEFSVLGYPVIQTGKFNTSNKGFLFEAETEDLFYDYLNEVKNETLTITEEMKERALLYAYYWVYRRHIQDTTQILEKLNFKEYQFDNEQEFIKNDTLNFVYDKIINKERIIIN